MKSTNLAVALWGIMLAMSGCNRPSFTMPGHAMEPTIQEREKVVFDSSAYADRLPQRWDVVALHPLNATDKDMTWALRVAGLPGEQVSFSTDGNILIDGKPLQRPPQIASVHFVAGRDDAVVTVPKESYYLLGDNSNHAYDSRYWGCLPRANIIGKVIGK